MSLNKNTSKIKTNHKMTSQNTPNLFESFLLKLVIITIIILPSATSRSQFKADNHKSLKFANSLEKIQAVQYLFDSYKSSSAIHSRKRRSNANYFEELKAPDLKRECLEEVCSREEMAEIMEHDEAKTRAMYFALTQSCTQGGKLLEPYINRRMDRCDSRRTLRCIQDFGRHTCECLPGWTGFDCSQPIDYCNDPKYLTNASNKDDNLSICPKGYQCINFNRDNKRGSRTGSIIDNPEPQDVGFDCVIRPGFEYLKADENQDDDELNIRMTFIIKEPRRDGNFEKLKFFREFKAVQDINECQINNIQCPDDRECHNIDGSYYCKCRSGYTDPITDIQKLIDLNNSKSYEKCIDIDECSLNHDLCTRNDQNSVCENKIGGYECVCKQGYERFANGAGDTGNLCMDVNECSVYQLNSINNSNNCLICNNKEPGYEINCKYGKPIQTHFLENNDGTIKYECVDIDECALQTHNCPEHSICKNKSNMEEQCGVDLDNFRSDNNDDDSKYLGYTCECEKPYKMKNGFCVLCEWDYDDVEFRFEGMVRGVFRKYDFESRYRSTHYS